MWGAVGTALLVAASIALGVNNIVYAALCSYVAWCLFRQYERRKEIQQFAQSTGFSFLGGSLPPTFPMQQTSSRWARSIGHAVMGDRNKKRLVLFDCRMGGGKSRFQRSVLAVRGQDHAFGVAQYGPDLLTEKVGDWTLVYGGHRLLSMEEIEALVGEM
jgi:hypothetical protein